MNNGRKEYTLLWFIENYSYCWHKNGERLYSPNFILEGLESTSWLLWFYPKGNTVSERGKISIFFGRYINDAGPDFLLLKCEISVLAEDGSTLKSEQSELQFKKGLYNGNPDFLDLEEDLSRRSSEYLAQDTLRLRLRIWYGEGSIHTVGKYFSRTRIGIEKISFLHKVESFSTLEPNIKNTIQIKSPSHTGCVISSSLYFTDDLFCDGTIIVEIVPSDGRYTLRKQKISLLDGSGEVFECGTVDNQFDKEDKDIEKLPLSFTRKAILNRKREYLPNDELSLLCECTFSTGKEVDKIEEIQYDIPATANIKPIVNTESCKNRYNIPEKLSVCPSALQDLKSFYSNKVLTDVELKTKTKSFRAHKLVLCARSSVFEAMQTSDMKEKNTDCIQVDDLENDTVQQLLLFLYSDNIENIQWESAMNLYYAGDKYAIEKLKLICSSFLVQNLNTSNVSEILLLADNHNDSDLKCFVEDFILDHEEEVFGSDEWEKLIETNPQLVIKVMHLKYKKKKGGK